MQIIADRRALHRIPELGRELPRTRAYIYNVLVELGCEVFQPTEWDICAFFDFGADHAIAFRADMDALPLQETGDCEFRSCHKGQMHACGHDGHMAILLELARRLDRQRGLKHNVLLVFQSAEETIGGAEGICESGVFEKYNVTGIFGLHLWPGLEEGNIFSRPGCLMARSAEVTVEFFGRSSHIAKPQEGADALAAAHHFYSMSRQLEDRFIPPGRGLLNYGRMSAGQVRNAIAGYAVLEGTLRCDDELLFRHVKRGIEDQARQAAQDGVRVKLHFSDGYPCVNNDRVLLGKALQAAPIEMLGEPSMTSEDFSFYQQVIPGVFFFLGLGDVPPLHSQYFHFDERVLEKGADFFLTLAKELP